MQLSEYPRHTAASYSTAVNTIHKHCRTTHFNNMPVNCQSLTVMLKHFVALYDQRRLTVKPNTVVFYLDAYHRVCPLFPPHIAPVQSALRPTVKRLSVEAMEVTRREPWYQDMLATLTMTAAARMTSLVSLPPPCRLAHILLRWSGCRGHELLGPHATITLTSTHLEVRIGQHKTSSRGAPPILRLLPRHLFGDLLAQIWSPGVTGVVTETLPTWTELRTSTLPVWPLLDHHSWRRVRAVELARHLVVEDVARWLGHGAKSTTYLYLRCLPPPVRSNFDLLWMPTSTPAQAAEELTVLRTSPDQLMA